MFWDILPEICSLIIWHENAIGCLRHLFMHSRGIIKICYALERDHESFTITEHFKLPLLTVFVNNSLTK